SLTRYHNLQTRIKGTIKKFDDVNKKKAGEIIRKAKEASREILSATDVYQILSAYNIPVADWRMADTTGDTVKAAEEIGFPVVIKADSESIVHKSDVGGVAINIKDSAAVISVAEKMIKKFDTKNLRFFVQKFLPGGRELIIGAKAEKGLGHLVMFGLGGIFVEVFKDVVFNIAPLSDTEASEMLGSIKAAPLIKGVRGEKGVCQNCVIEIIQRISQLVTDLPEIQEMDLNPIIAYEDKVFVVDARIKI
ncbi:MAG: acetate--CoA ligase family protein, partial [Bacteroidota bacterium]